MEQGLPPIIHHTLMRILVALYESGLVEHVALADVLKLFGADPDPDAEAVVFRFDDPGWVQAYTSFKETGEEPAFVVFDDPDDIPEDVREEIFGSEENYQQWKEGYNGDIDPTDDLENWTPPDDEKGH